MKPLTYIVIAVSLAISCSNERSEQSEKIDTEEQTRGRVLDYSATIEFLNSSGEIVKTIDAAVADDDKSRSEGLMEVYDLPEDSGMLFIFENDQPRSFWMANTPLSLDILFVNSEFEIVRVHRDTEPFSQDNLHSEAAAKYTIEVNAGFTLKHDINEGMKVRFTDLKY